MIEPRPITHETVEQIWKLEVAEHQRRFVAPNLVTLAEAPYQGGAEVFGLWTGDTPVGLLAMLDLRQVHDLIDGDDPNSGFMWRLMIAPAFQGKGFGRQAVEFAKDWTRAKRLPRLVTSAEEENAPAFGLYASCGFVRTGRRFGGSELEMVVDLPEAADRD